MLFDNENRPSLGPKLFFLATLAGTVAAACAMMFADLGGIADGLVLRGDVMRRVLLAGCLLVYLARLVVTTLVFLRRSLPWPEVVPISILIPLALLGFARLGGANDQAIGAVEIVGLALYVIGSHLNSRSEYTRHVFKLRPENAGRLYTEGLFRHSMHINYFGDLLLFSGFALVAGAFSLFLIPGAMALNFVFNIIPRLDRHLEAKYGEEFAVYASRTKKLIPRIY